MKIQSQLMVKMMQILILLIWIAAWYLCRFNLFNNNVFGENLANLVAALKPFIGGILSGTIAFSGVAVAIYFHQKYE